MRTETIGDATLHLGDCRDVLPTLGAVDAVVTDPPYGIGADKVAHSNSGAVQGHGSRRVALRQYAQTDWDQAPSIEVLQSIMAAAQHQIIFGGNYFALPPAKCWLIWDKETGSNTYADCEMAWTNLDKPIRKIGWLWHGFARKNAEPRFDHPTQKPIGVMEWCIGHLPVDAHTVLDPFMGSGTTGVACAKLGRRFIGIELHEPYFDIACRRIEAAYKQADLFVSREPAPTLRTADMFAEPI